MQLILVDNVNCGHLKVKEVDKYQQCEQENVQIANLWIAQNHPNLLAQITCSSNNFVFYPLHFDLLASKIMNGGMH